MSKLVIVAEDVELKYAVMVTNELFNRGEYYRILKVGTLVGSIKGYQIEAKKEDGVIQVIVKEGKNVS